MGREGRSQSAIRRFDLMYERKPSEAAVRYHYEYAFASLGALSVKTAAVSKYRSFELADEVTAEACLHCELRSVFPPLQIR